MMNCAPRSLFGFASKRMVFSCRYGIKVPRNVLCLRTYSSQTNLSALWGETHKSEENPKSISYKVEEAKAGSDSDPTILKANCTKKENVVEEELTSIKKGDIVNLSDLIFTKNRDYLIKCNDGQRVKSEKLAGKVVVIYLMDRKHISYLDTESVTYLMNIHNELQPDNGFEVVFVDVNYVDASLSGEISPAPSCQEPQKQFEDILSSMPWTTIPLSDITSRKYLKQIFGLPKVVYCGFSFVIDPIGTVLQCGACTIFQKFGALGYPFSDERINYLKSEDNKVAKHPSLKALLASPQRDYLISNKGDKVPIHTLEDKVVALYFYEEGFTDKKITLELKTSYKELAKNNKKFEVVLIYLYDGPNTSNFTNEDSFWKTFKAMPWLALPFRDSIYKKLERIVHYPWLDNEPAESALIIIGPHMEFIEPFGVFILMHFKIPSFPFSREKVAKLLAEEAKELKLEMLWDPESVFGEKYGFEVQYSQLAGKRVIIIFESFIDHDREFLETLKEKYTQLKGTTDEFEVIHIIEESYNNESKVYHVANLPWFVQPAGAHHGYESNLFNFYERHVCYNGGCSLIAFDRDGRVVRRTIYPTVEDLDFPFYDGDLEKEALSQLVSVFLWDMLHYLHPGTIYSYKKSCNEVFKYYDSEGLHYPELEHLKNM